MPGACVLHAYVPIFPCHVHVDKHRRSPPIFLPIYISAAVHLASSKSSLETTQGQTDGFFSHLPFRCYLPEVASVGD